MENLQKSFSGGRLLSERGVSGASARTAIRVDPGILETYLGQYQFETLGNRIVDGFAG